MTTARLTTALAGLALLASRTGAQQAPPTQLRVDVRVASITLQGTTATARYVARNLAESGAPLWVLTVDAPAGLASIEEPRAATPWAAFTAHRGRPVARWAALGARVAPGEQTPELTFTATGLPEVVDYWATPTIEVPKLSETDDPDTMPPMNPLVERSLRGRTVGIGPLPAEQGPGALVGRLSGLLSRSCGELGWIEHDGICQSLRAKLDAASRSLAAGDSDAAADQLRSFIAELDAQHGPQPGKHVGDDAYWLLRPNAEFILAEM